MPSLLLYKFCLGLDYIHNGIVARDGIHEVQKHCNSC